MLDDIKTFVKYGYDQYAKVHSQSRGLFDDLTHLKAFTERLPQGAKILDAGCGNGLPIDKYLIDQGFDVTGVDISAEMVKSATTNVPRAKFTVSDFADLKFKPESFDAIIAFHSIYHIPMEAQSAVIKKFYTSTKTGGYLLLTTGSNYFDGTREIHQEIQMYFSHWGREKNTGIIIEAGYKVLYETIYSSNGIDHLIIFAQKPN